MKILLVSDAWTPQVNGVVRTLSTTVDKLRALGHEVVTLTPDLFRSLPCPTYPEIRLAMTTPWAVGNRIDAIAPDAIHIATEGPLGFFARNACVKRGLVFTTAYHTQFPDYLAMRTKLPIRWFWNYIRWFHNGAHATLVATSRLARELQDQGISRTRPWSRGVDLTQFYPRAERAEEFVNLPRPIQLYVGRVAVEKNIEAFLASNHPGSKVVVGDGPARAELQRSYPHVHFLGLKQGDALAAAYASADIFIFPSKTDTFGLVMLEAMASGAPVAAFPVPGPLDVIGANGRGTQHEFDAPIGALREDLTTAIEEALVCDRQECVKYAERFSWDNCIEQFLNALAPANSIEARDFTVIARTNLAQV
jgi:glycosyltransferase involved in cell wall biosynthesis